MPSIHQDKEHELKGQRYHHRRQHHHAHGQQHRGHNHVNDQKGNVQDKAHDESGLELGDDIGRNQGQQGDFIPGLGPLDVPLLALIPAYVISELKTAFIVGFVLYIPFLVIDMVVASVLLAMGMMMLPPVMISLPFKLMLFVLVDGWHLISGSLLKSFGV